MLNPSLYWLLIGVILFILEVVSPGFVLIFFASGAMLTALVAWLIPATSIALQLAIFMIASLVALFSLRSVIKKRFFAAAPKQGEDDHDIPLVAVGERGVVCLAIVPPAEGRIKCSGSTWRATADTSIAEGEIVTVVRQAGMVFHVEKA